MKEIMFLVFLMFTTVARLLGLGGGRAIVAENLLGGLGQNCQLGEWREL
jgi:hypothetical protein